jgi:branched-chain amino acid transport system substrate-binding protein
MKKIYLGIAVAVALALLAAISITQNNMQPQDTIKIGALFALSGAASEWGNNSLNGAQLAIEEINSLGGINEKTIEFKVEDTTTNNPVQALNAYQKLVSDDKINIILGTTWSPEALAIAPNACKDKVLMISPTLGVKEFNEECEYLFNLWPHDENLSRALGKTLYEKGYKKIAILGSLQVWEHQQADAVKNAFKEAGGEVVSYQLVKVDEQDFKAETLKIKESDAQAVVLTNLSTEHISAKRLRETGYDKPFYLVLIDQDKVNAAQGAFEGTEVITSFSPSKEFAEKYYAKFGVKADIGADTTYDAIYLIKEAIEKTGSTDPTKIQEYINKLKSYDGASGHLIFDVKGGVEKTPSFVKIINNSIVKLQQ